MNARTVLEMREWVMGNGEWVGNGEPGIGNELRSDPVSRIPTRHQFPLTDHRR